MVRLTAGCTRAQLSLCVLVIGVTTPLASAQNLGLTRVATGLNSPIFATYAPGDSNDLYVVERAGDVKILNLTTGVVSPTPFLTVPNVSTNGEEGLLGLAFDPNYATNHSLYIDYTANGGTAGVTTIARIVAPVIGNVGTTAGTTVLAIDQPFTNHKGGWIGFSPAGTRAGDSGNLYISTGDGGSANDPFNNGQNTSSLLGKMLRIDVEHPANGQQYSIPATNPFGNEVFDYGLRNPFRASFDRQTGNLMIADVGQGAREEIDVQKASHPAGGENYGWRLREGNIQTPGVGGAVPANYVAPILDYQHPASTGAVSGQDVIGGYVYRGTAIPGLNGTYIFGDELGPSGGTGSQIFSLKYDGTNVTDVQNLTSTLFAANGFSLHNVYSFAEDARGELYILDGTAGTIFRIVPEPSTLALLVLGTLALLVAGSGFRLAAECGASAARYRSPTPS